MTDKQRGKAITELADQIYALITNDEASEYNITWDNLNSLVSDLEHGKD